MRALVVEDSMLLRRSLVAALRRIDGLVCVEAADGADALKRLMTEGFDIILTDINMPVMDGLKLISAVRAMPQHADVPIVVITTEGAQQDRDRAMGLGASWYMVKPVQAPDVIVVVKELLNLTS